ncbi:MAG: OmpA family protein, partial [Bacteroidia bacterium]|nr:OmpA family protein [Bacteroidia bacterium]
YEVGEVESLFFNIGVTDNNYFAYETFVNNLAPLDLAWVALQRMIESDIKNKDWTSAKVTLTEFEAKFQTKNGNKVTDLLNELEKAETSVTISSLKRVNTAYDEYAPVPSLDGKRLFFCGKERKDNIGGEDIFESSGKNGVFGTADMVSSLSSPYGNEAPLSISADGNTMFLWTGDSNGDIQTSSIGLNGLWTAPVSLPYPINTKYYEGDAMLSADGRTIIFVSTRPGGENFYVENNMSYFGDDNYQTDIYISNKLDNGKWSNPVNLGSKINTPYSERSPYLHPDGKTLYFSSEGHAGFGRLDVFKSTLLSEDWRDWSVPENLGKEINSSENDWGFKFSTDGKNVFYAAKEKSAEKSSLILLLDVSGSMGEGNKMEAMREAAHEVCVSALANNTEVSILAFNGSCYEPFSFYCQFSDDAKQLTDFISDVYADGGTPMYEAFEMASVYMKDAAQKSSASKSIILMSDGDANSCETLKAVIGRLRSKGSIYKTYTIALEVDEGSQAYDDLMYISTRTKGAFFHAETAEDLGTVFAQASTKIFDFTMKSSSSDIFTFTLPEDLRPELVTTISGVIKNSKSQPISAKVSWEDLSTGENMGTATTNPSDGSYFIVLPTGRNYGYFVDNARYFPSSNNVDLRNASSMEEIKVDVDMVSFEELLSGNKSVKINNIFFETAKFDLKSESFVELNRILPILNEYIDYQVVIEGHTDNVGNKNYNIELSEKRALAVANYLNSKGYKRDDIEFIGYGFEQPVNDNSTASKKALNRRVEIKLIKK